MKLAFAMLRYRTASLLLPFFLLAPALHGRLGELRWSYVAGVVALFASYIVATCVNDLFDLEIDRVNTPDRPLASGRTTSRALVVTAVVAAGVALAVAPSLAVILMSLLFNVAYSAWISRRPHLAAPSLAVAYVALPYALGLGAAGVAASWLDARVVTGLVVLFTGRMLLKDFRDVRGDAMFAKRTFLLVHGRRATVIAVLICVVVGDALLFTVLPLVVQTFFAAIVFELFRLHRGADALEAIARGARMGNAAILTWLGVAILPASEAGVFAVAMAALYWLVYFLPAPHPAALAGRARPTSPHGAEVRLPAPAAATAATAARETSTAEPARAT